MLKSPTVELFSHSRRVLTRLIRAMCEISGNIVYLAKAHRGAGLPPVHQVGVTGNMRFFLESRTFGGTSTWCTVPCVGFKNS